MMKISMKPKWRIVGCILSIILLLGSLFYMVRQLTGTITRSIEEHLFEGTITPYSEYTITLKENDYITEKEIPQGSKYIRALMDNLKLDMGITYIGSEEAQVSGNYKIYARIVGYQSAGNNSETIWYKEVPLYEKEISQVGVQLKVGEEFPVKLETYEALVTQANSDFGVSLSYDFSVRMEGKLEVESESGILELPFESFVSIPLNNSIFEVTTSESTPTSNHISQWTKVEEPRPRKYVPFSIVGILIGIVAMVVLIFLTQNPSEEDLRKKKWCQELRNHKSRMVELTCMPKLQAQQIYMVNSLEDLIKLSDEIQMPIFYISDDENIIADNSMFIIKGEQLYLFHV